MTPLMTNLYKGLGQTNQGENFFNSFTKLNYNLQWPFFFRLYMKYGSKAVGLMQQVIFCFCFTHTKKFQVLGEIMYSVIFWRAGTGYRYVSMPSLCGNTELAEEFLISYHSLHLSV